MVSNYHFLKCLYFMPFFSRTGFSQEICDSNTGPVCCDGYYRNQITGNCTSCKPGYFDFNCSKKCGYPTYGEKCQQICSCSEKKCHFAIGCRLNTEKSGTIVSQISTEPLSLKVKSSLLLMTEMASIAINLDRSYEAQDKNTYTKTITISGNESIILKTSSNILHVTPNLSFFPSAVIIVAIICSTLFLFVAVIAVALLIRKHVHTRKRKLRVVNDPVDVSDTMTSEYDVLNNRNVFRGLAEISIDYSEITQSYSVNFKTKALDPAQSSIQVQDSGHVYLDLDDNRK